MRTPKITVVGSSNTDLSVRSERLPRPGETVTGGQFSRAGGGKGANQAVAARRLGAEVSFVGRVGDDRLGHASVKRLREEEIETGSVVFDDEASSGVALIMIDAHGENMISVAPGANHRLTAEDVEKARADISNADVVLVQLEIPLDTVEAVLSVARDGGATTILDPAPVPNGGLPRRIFEQVDVITPNRSEAGTLAELGPDAEPEDAAAVLNGKGTNVVAVTLGAAGLYLRGDDGNMSLPAAPAEPVDTVGAGDCFAAGLAVGLAAEQTWQDAAKFALCAAAISTEREGAQPSMPTLTETQGRLNAYNEERKD